MLSEQFKSVAPTLDAARILIFLTFPLATSCEWFATNHLQPCDALVVIDLVTSKFGSDTPPSVNHFPDETTKLVNKF